MRLFLLFLCTLSFFSGKTQAAHHSLHLDEKSRDPVFCLSADALPTGVINAFDSLILLKFDWEGNILLQKTAHRFQDEDVWIHEFQALPDSGFILSYEAANCDVGVGTTCLVKYDKDFNIVWVDCRREIQHSLVLPRKFSLMPNGTIIGESTHKMVAVNTSDGRILWTVPIKPLNWNFFYPVALFPYDNSNELLEGITYGGSYFKMEPAFYPSDSSYILHETDYGLDFYANQLVHEPSLGMIAVVENEKKAYRYTASGFTVEPFPVSAVALNSTNLTMFGDGEWHYAQNTGSFDNWQNDFLSPQGLLVHQDKFFLYGLEYYHEVPLFPGDFIANNFWFTIVKNYDYSVDEPAWNASVTQIEQTAPMNFLPNSNWIWGGGDFKVEVENKGETVLDSLIIVAEYAQTRMSFCPEPIRETRHYSNLNIPAGGSKLVDFGDLYALYSPDNKEWNQEICFWAMAPTGEIDVNHNDDMACRDRLVSTNTISDSDISLYPNPSSDRVFLENLPEKPQTAFIFDVFGKKVMGMEVSRGENGLNISELYTGIYFLKIENFTKKIIKN